MFKVAYRNIFLNKRRTIFTMLSISIGCVSLLLALGFITASYEGLAMNFISDSGHLQIFNKNYFVSNDITGGAKIQNPEKIINQIKRFNSVDVVTARMTFSGLIGNANNTKMMVGEAIVPEEEKKIGLGGFFAPLESGKYFTSSDEDGSIIGQGLADKLKVKPGDYLTILSNTSAGSYNSTNVLVTGIVKYSVTEYNDSKVAVNLTHAQNLLNENSVDNIVILLNSASNVPKVKKQVTSFIEKNNLPLIVKSWDEISPYYHQVKALYNRLFTFLVVLIVVIMTFSITNNVMMSVFERFREIGTIRAIGSNKLKIASLFIYESAILGILGWIIGVALSYLISHLIMNMGIMMPPAPGRTYSYPLSFDIQTSYYYYILIVCITVSVFSGLFPAMKAGRTEIINALKYV